VRGTQLLVSIIAVSGLASAKPLPAGYKVALVKKQVMVTHDGVSVLLINGEFEKLASAELSDDGKAIVVKVQCNDEDPQPDEVLLATIDAQVENMLGMSFHNKKQYDDAFKHFTLAAQKAPDTSLYATNLLSAQSMSGKLDDADRTVATYGKTNPAWFAWRLAVDPELKALKGRPGAKLDAPKRGTASSKLREKVAYSPLGLVASEVSINVWDGIPDGSSEAELVIADIATGKDLLHLPTEKTCGYDPATMMTDKPPQYADKACPKKEAAKAAANRKIADALLAQLGFDVVPKAYVEVKDKDTLAASDGRKLSIKDNKVYAGTTARELPVMNQIWAAGFVPKGLALITRYKHVGRCEADGPRMFELTAVPTP
jgi:hypothetical protein